MGWGYHWYIDVLCHGAYYFSITLLVLAQYRKKIHPRRFYLFALALSTLLECVQAFVPGRSISLLDLMSNNIGISGATGLYYGIQIKRSFSKR